MNIFSNVTCFKYAFVILGIVFISIQFSYAQTIEEFLTKERSEQREIIENIASLEIERLISSNIDNVQKSQAQITQDRRLANFIRAFCTNYEIQKDLNVSSSEPYFVSNLIVTANTFKKIYAKTLFRDFFVKRVNTFFDLQYSNATNEWMEAFDSKADKQQVFQFRAEQLARDRESSKKDKIIIKDYLNSQIKDAESEKEAALKKIEENSKKLDENNKKIKELNEKSKAVNDLTRSIAIAAIKKLEVSFRPLKSNPRMGSLIFRSVEEIPTEFSLQCYINNNKSKTLSVSISENGEITFTQGKNANFILGERCEFYFDSENIRSYTVSSK